MNWTYLWEPALNWTYQKERAVQAMRTMAGS